MCEYCKEPHGNPLTDRSFGKSRIEYDVEVPEKTKQISEIAKFFLGFMADNTHKSVSIEFGEKERGADRAYNSLRKIVAREGADVSLNVRGNVLYITKNNFTPEKIVVPKSLSDKKEVEKLIAKEVSEKASAPKKKRGRPSKCDINPDEVWAYYILHTGITQADMAKHFGFSTTTINKILQGKRKKKEFSEEKNGISDAELAKIVGK